MDKSKDEQVITERRIWLAQRMVEYGIPDYMQEGLLAYIIDARSVGGFLQAVIANDLKAAVHRGDDINQRALHCYMKFLYNHAPNACFGHEGAAAYWKSKGGLRGYLAGSIKLGSKMREIPLKEEDRKQEDANG
jgi:hypothetical protein